MPMAEKLLQEAAERREKIAKLYSQGVERDFIAMRLGIKRSTVTVIIQELVNKGKLSRNRFL